MIKMLRRSVYLNYKDDKKALSLDWVFSCCEENLMNSSVFDKFQNTF